MLDIVVRNKAELLKLVNDTKDIVSVAVAGDKLIIGVCLGKEKDVEKAVSEPLIKMGISYDVCWEITVSKYPVKVVSNRVWLLD